MVEILKDHTIPVNFGNSALVISTIYVWCSNLAK